MENNRPLISVAMGVYFRGQDLLCLQRSIESILNQTFGEFELLICDDGSSESAVNLIDSYAGLDSRIRLVRPGNCFRLPEKLNRCIQMAKGRYIARMDDDDWSHVDRFAKEIDALEQHPECAFVGCNVNLSCNGNIVGKRKLPEYPEVRDFFFVQPYIHPTLIFRASVLSEVDGYCEDKRCDLCEDYDLLLRLYAKGYKGMNLQADLLDYTIPANAHGKRRLCHRWNETVTRYLRFRELRVLPRAWPYVIKPIAVGLVPDPILRVLKRKQ